MRSSSRQGALGQKKLKALKKCRTFTAPLLHFCLFCVAQPYATRRKTLVVDRRTKLSINIMSSCLRLFGENGKFMCFYLRVSSLYSFLNTSELIKKNSVT